MISVIHRPPAGPSRTIGVPADGLVAGRGPFDVGLALDRTDDTVSARALVLVPHRRSLLVTNVSSYAEASVRSPHGVTPLRREAEGGVPVAAGAGDRIVLRAGRGDHVLEVFVDDGEELASPSAEPPGRGGTRRPGRPDPIDLTPGQRDLLAALRAPWLLDRDPRLPTHDELGTRLGGVSAKGVERRLARLAEHLAGRLGEPVATKADLAAVADRHGLVTVADVPGDR